MNKHSLADIYSGMVTAVGIVGIGIEKYQISALQLSDFLNFFTGIAVPLIISGTRKRKTEVCKYGAGKTGTVISLGANGSQDGLPRKS